MDLTIKHEDNKFYVGDSVKDPEGWIEYQLKEGGVVSADHTIVKTSLQGKGVASKLFQEFMKWVKEEDLKVEPRCSFIEKKMKEDPEFKAYIV